MISPPRAGHDVVEADRCEVGAPHPPPLEGGGGIGGAQRVEEGARAHREVEPEEDEPQPKRQPVHRRQVGEELSGRIEERADALADRG